MRVDELNPKQTDFFNKLYELCKEYDASIVGCGCCGSPQVRIGREWFERLDAEPNCLDVYLGNGRVIIRESYHDISVSVEHKMPDDGFDYPDESYGLNEYTASCSKCGKKKTSNNAYDAIEMLEDIPCE